MPHRAPARARTGPADLDAGLTVNLVNDGALTEVYIDVDDLFQRWQRYPYF
jgi:hypothetical protein